MELRFPPGSASALLCAAVQARSLNIAVYRASPLPTNTPHMCQSARGRECSDHGQHVSRQIAPIRPARRLHLELATRRLKSCLHVKAYLLELNRAYARSRADTSASMLPETCRSRSYEHCACCGVVRTMPFSSFKPCSYCKTVCRREHVLPYYHSWLALSRMQNKYVTDINACTLTERPRSPKMCHFERI